MSYFDPRKETEIIVDASPVGLGGLLMQEGKIITYAIQALSDVESIYSQTEREMLTTVCVQGQLVNCHRPQATNWYIHALTGGS